MCLDPNSGETQFGMGNRAATLCTACKVNATGAVGRNALSCLLPAAKHEMKTIDVTIWRVWYGKKMKKTF
jgi:hypothetical protein